ncbi:hypothetical protein NPIL_580521 [Nephila pilipes]|uniref:Uncharacterized protein n=1 Tax=Nephila pilipes TaxID=299642 RepID=A0A8X6UFY5_NEPPI|nr:hypothetical protein NPIL_580521 [Nephila pilipes]
MFFFSVLNTDQKSKSFYSLNWRDTNSYCDPDFRSNSKISKLEFSTLRKRRVKYAIRTLRDELMEVSESRMRAVLVSRSGRQSVSSRDADVNFNWNYPKFFPDTCMILKEMNTISGKADRDSENQ